MKSIKSRLVIIFTLILFISSGLLGFLSIMNASKALLTKTEETLLNTTIEATKYLEARINTQKLYIETISQNPILMKEEISWEEFVTVAAGMIAATWADTAGVVGHHHMISWLYLGDSATDLLYHPGSLVTQHHRKGGWQMPGDDYQISMADTGSYHPHLDLMAAGCFKGERLYRELPTLFAGDSSFYFHEMTSESLFVLHDCGCTNWI